MAWSAESSDTRARGGTSVKRDGSRERSQRGRGGGQWPHISITARATALSRRPVSALWLLATEPPVTAPLCRSAAIDCRMTRRPCCSVRRLWLPAMAPRCNQVDASQGSRASPPLVLRFCLLNALSLPRAFAGPSHMGPAGEAPAVVTEAQGWRLHLSSRSSTGYAGVRKQEQASGSRGRRPPGRRAASRRTK